MKCKFILVLSANAISGLTLLTIFSVSNFGNIFSIDEALKKKKKIYMNLFYQFICPTK